MIAVGASVLFVIYIHYTTIVTAPGDRPFGRTPFVDSLCGEMFVAKEALSRQLLRGSLSAFTPQSLLLLVALGRGSRMNVKESQKEKKNEISPPLFFCFPSIRRSVFHSKDQRFFVGFMGSHFIIEFI